MRHRLYVHLVWTTRGRAPMIDAARARFLDRYLQAIAIQERAELLALGMVTDHVHLLLRIVPMTVISRMVQRMKGGSSHLVRKEGIGALPMPLLWEEGYNLETVSPFARDRLGRYVLSQAEHHPDNAIPGWHAAARITPDISPRYHAIRVEDENPESPTTPMTAPSLSQQGFTPD
jgi:REP element-mobilizing transposase RayT